MTLNSHTSAFQPKIIEPCKYNIKVGTKTETGDSLVYGKHWHTELKFIYLYLNGLRYGICKGKNEIQKPYDQPKF